MSRNRQEASPFIENAKNTFPSGGARERCRKNGCELSGKDLPRSLGLRWLVDVDGIDDVPRDEERKCDYFFFCVKDSANWVALIEMKRGEANEGVLRQLQGSADYMANKNLLQGEEVAFRPVVACRGVSRHVRDFLRKKGNRVEFDGVRYEIKIKGCGSKLIDVIR